MRIQASVGAGIERRSRHASQPHEAAGKAPGTALPALIGASRRPAVEQRPQIRPLATVVAQLAASAGDHPSTRARRRADPLEGANLYGFAAAVTPQARKTTIRVL